MAEFTQVLWRWSEAADLAVAEVFNVLLHLAEAVPR